MVLSMPVPRRARKHGHDDVRPEPAHHAHGVLEQGVRGPEPEGFLERLGEAEVVRPREELLGAIRGARGQQLARAQQAQRLSQLFPDQVLPTFAPRERQVGGPRTVALCRKGQELGVFVVGVRPDHQDPPRLGDALEEAIELDHPAGRWRG